MGEEDDKKESSAAIRPVRCSANKSTSQRNWTALTSTLRSSATAEDGPTLSPRRGEGISGWLASFVAGGARKFVRTPFGCERVVPIRSAARIHVLLL